ncbi:MAG: YraN family protein, partial [Treponema sp.]|nr:YraN family protein [Treponema sp.]
MPKQKPENRPEIPPPSRCRSNTGRGRDGEARAAGFLEERGMRIIARNVRSPGGEVDIVALDGETLVFAEVKAWSGYGIENLQYGINPKKQRR